MLKAIGDVLSVVGELAQKYTTLRQQQPAGQQLDGASSQGSGELNSRTRFERQLSELQNNPPSSTQVSAAISNDVYLASGSEKDRDVAIQRSSPYYYSNTPNIELLKADQAASVVKEFWKSIEAFSKDRAGRELTVPPDGPGELAPTRPDLEAWKERSDGAVGSAIVMQEGPEDKLVYTLQEAPIAVMTLQQRRVDIEIKHLATHPAVYGAGETMLESAINRSQAAGHGGKVSLVATPEAHGFYEKNGFKMDRHGRWSLVPSASEFWGKKSDIWILKKNEGKKYLTGAPADRS
ncbi:GNAT family N-acetyltransferase [Bradyrhizobium sp. Pear77]|uniref:GNAT family N-acetyltransferase n=1 Tax=Bradyrhizobium TaxID=374 RepID=UPI001E4553C5|nr:MULTISPECIES: GNAT family N-acetyltransferase [Bradyrhizobium]MCC8957609.1 GNAT family N-acetyltransferase [Bradyrhizobium altum]MCC8968473.1 GNAT family N-acetyltransferase [Bradyrhizobium oropedii]